MTLNLRIALSAAALAAACATSHPVAGTWNCGGSMERAVAERGTELYASPDGTSKSLAQFNDVQAVCAEADVKGFGFKRVTLADGRSGFVRESNLMTP